MDQQLLNDIIQWDVKNWSKLVNHWKPVIESKNHKTALALGEREGGLSLWMALNNKDVTCTDYRLSDTLPLALHVKHNVQDKIKYAQEDVTNLSYKNESFDIVIFKSIIGDLKNKENQAKALKEAYRVLKPGGFLLFAENLRATKTHQFARDKFTNWGKDWIYPKLEDFKTNCSQFKSFEYETHGFLATFGRSEKQRFFLGKIDQLIKPITPKNWQYILFGTVQK